MLKKSNHLKLETPSRPQIENTMGRYDGSWVTDYAWISGLSGAIITFALAAWFNAAQVLNKGLFVLEFQITKSRSESIFAALLIVTFSMVLVECLRLWLRDKNQFFALHPKIRNGAYFGFILECFINFLLYLLLLSLVIQIYHSVNEYGYIRDNAYYQNWFTFIDLVWTGYLWAGFPYVLITRAFKYDEESDKRDYGFYCARLLLWPIDKIFGSLDAKFRLKEIDRKITRGLFVKLFFTPIMTVFFFNNFPHLSNNIGYVFGDLFGNSGLWSKVASGSYTNSMLNNDLFNISTSVIFSIDVALAWCGYVISSRWVDNQTISAEPTTLGWVVCLLCYPPAQVVTGWLYSPPGEKEAIYMFDVQWVITFFLILMIASYFIYMLATLWFGTRFSNLTHRGIIRKGPFAIIRHPAYASKNFAWWCIMFPAIIYNAIDNHIGTAVIQFLGLVLMTKLYYWRAITEERHLSIDPAYHEYCKHVRYRFIPGII